MKARYLTENALETLKHSIDTYLPLFKEETNAALVEKLKADLEKRVGVSIDKLEVGHVDFLRDAAFIKIYPFPEDKR